MAGCAEHASRLRTAAPSRLRAAVSATRSGHHAAAPFVSLLSAEKSENQNLPTRHELGKPLPDLDAQDAAGLEEVIAHGGFAAPEDPGDFAAVRVLELPQDEHEALLGGQGGRAALEHASDLALGEKRGTVGRRARAWVLHEAKALGLRALPRPARAQRVDREIAGDAKEPRRERV